jgi:peroxiredoxin
MQNTPKTLSDLDVPKVLSNKGNTLFQLSKKSPVLLIFLRHFGCVFCKEALDDLSKKKNELEEKGISLVFVHMANDEMAEEYFIKYNIAGAEAFADPECILYAKFGLTKGSSNQLLGFMTWYRSFEAGVIKGHGLSIRQIGDGFQMPGVFLLKNEMIVESFIHKFVSDIPNYDEIIQQADLH